MIQKLQKSRNYTGLTAHEDLLLYVLMLLPWKWWKDAPGIYHRAMDAFAIRWTSNILVHVERKGKPRTKSFEDPVQWIWYWKWELRVHFLAGSKMSATPSAPGFSKFPCERLMPCPYLQTGNFAQKHGVYWLCLASSIVSFCISLHLLRIDQEAPEGPTVELWRIKRRQEGQCSEMLQVMLLNCLQKLSNVSKEYTQL